MQSTSEHRFRRHDLVWLDATRWRGALQSPLDAAALAALDIWFCDRRPAVVRRHERAANRHLGLGVALPPTYSERRIPLDIDASVVRHTSPPLPLVRVIPSAPERWRPELARLAAGANSMGVDLRVYGSLVWQHVSREPYVLPTSDVDLLWRAADTATLEKMLDYLVRWENSSGLAADGELLLADDTAVAWKELLRHPRQLLIKRTTGVELCDYEDVLCLIAPTVCCTT